MDTQQPPSTAGIAPLSFAIGIAVSLVGLIVNPLVIAPLGGAIFLLAATVWSAAATGRLRQRTNRMRRRRPPRRKSATTRSRANRPGRAAARRIARPCGRRDRNAVCGGRWFDVVTARRPVAVALATAEALAVELPLALLCLWVAQRLATPQRHHPTAPTKPEGALQ